MRAVFDYVIVGAGSAGCVLANRLSQDPSTRVLLVEAGRSDKDLILHVPGLSIRNSTTPRFNWSFTTEAVDALDGRKLFWAQGKAIGGSSAVNGMIYARGNPKEYDAWRDAGCAGWGFEDVLPFFKRSEGNERGESHWHGGDGPLKVSRGRPTLEIADRVLEAAAQDGFEIRDDFNTDEQEGFGHYDCTIDRGRRCSSATAFLHPVRSRPNLDVMADTLALRILFEGDRATGLDLATEGRLHAVRAEREVILCCGAINSPQLLMLSGIGPADHLSANGIAVRIDRPSVGANLQNHVSYRLQYGVSEPITAFRYVNLKGAAKAGLDYVIHRRGVLADFGRPVRRVLAHRARNGRDRRANPGWRRAHGPARQKRYAEVAEGARLLARRKPGPAVQPGRGAIAERGSRCASDDRATLFQRSQGRRYDREGHRADDIACRSSRARKDHLKRAQQSPCCDTRCDRRGDP